MCQLALGIYCMSLDSLGLAVKLELVNISPLYCGVYLENIGFVYPAMSMVVIGPSLLY
jgi:hypothetical protein